MPAYDPFAKLYNRHWGGLVKLLVPVLDHLVLNDRSVPAHILDLCCGTGQLAHILTQRGYYVTGLDESTAMLDFARHNAPQADFIKADARDFTLKPAFDLALSTFDSLNHLMTLADLTHTIEAVYAALKPGGVFVFDMNMETGYQMRGTGTFGKADDDLAFSAEYGTRSDRAYLKLTVFDYINGWQRSDFTLWQTWYTQHEIESTLDSAGFANVQVVDAVQFGHKQQPNDSLFFMARKP